MPKSAALTLKIISDDDILDKIPRAKSLTEEQKKMIEMIVHMSVDEYIKKTKNTVKSDYQTDRVVRISEVIRITGISRTSIYSYIKKGIFPTAIKLGVRCSGWRMSEIQNWLENKDSPKSSCG